MSTNQAVVSGRIGNDVLLKQFSDGSQVCNINLAVSDFYTQNGASVEKTTWIQVAIWGPMAANTAKFKVKGDFLIVTGTIETPRAWLDKNGKPQASPAIRATSVDFGPKTHSAQPQPQPQEAYAVAPEGELPPA